VISKCAAFLLAVVALPVAASSQQPTAPDQRVQFAPLPIPVDVKTHVSGERRHWVRYEQCQMQFEVTLDASTWIPAVADPVAQPDRIDRCVRTAVQEHVDVLVLPEVALAIPKPARERVFALLASTARSAHMLIIGGSFYDDARKSRIAYFGPNWTELGYKIRPSRFEVSPIAGHGMVEGDSIVLIQTEFGNIAAITCVDLISDDVQASVRRLIDERRLDVLVNINYNPASWEFLIEANSLARRHPVFVSITNAVPPASGYAAATCKPASNEDDGYCYGHSAIFSSLNANYGADDIGSDLVPDAFLISSKTPPGAQPVRKPIRKQLAYSYLVADTGTFRERALIYELNMELPRLAADTTAPDQGYPTIRNVKIRDLTP
jgi:predicted amidohydrolase